MVTVRGADGATATIQATDWHPVWDDDQHAWVPIGQLPVGDHVHSFDGSHPLVVSIHHVNVAVPVYNLTVDGVHTYMITAEAIAVLVHNDGGDPEFRIAGDYRGRVDRFTYKGQAYFEVHVKYKGAEVGIYGSNGWIGKHGHSPDMPLGSTVENRLKGVAVDEMRRAGRLGPNDSVKGDAWKRPHVGEVSC